MSQASPFALPDVMRAAYFAADRHARQVRKGEAAEPYVNHLLEVAYLLAQATGGNDAGLVMAGLLHDSIEDVEVTAEELEREFGPDVTALVLDVTDDRDLPRQARKDMQVRTAPHKSDRAKMLKLADKISNLRSLLVGPPPDWTRTRRYEYFVWSGQVAAGCRGVNAWLEGLFDEAHAAGLKMYSE